MATRVDCEARDFHHPYEPYGIQETFMEAVYQTLENKQIGIFESPTGTVSRRLPSVHRINIHVMFTVLFFFQN